MTVETYSERIFHQLAGRDAHDEAERARRAGLEAERTQQLIAERNAFAEARAQAQAAALARAEHCRQLRSQLTDTRTRCLAEAKELLRNDELDTAIELSARATAVDALLRLVSEIESEPAPRPVLR